MDRAIVVEALSARQGGGQTYLHNLFERYEQKDNERVIAIVPLQHRKVFEVNPSIEILSPRFASASIANRIIWNRLSLPKLLRDLRADVLYCPGGFLAAKPVQGCRTAVAFRNMMPFSPQRTRVPFGYTRLRLWALKHIQSASFRDADLVLFISRFGESVINDTVGERSGRSVVIPHGLSEHFFKPRPRPADSRLPDEYVLYVSILNVYKAQAEVVIAWDRMRRLRRTREKLILIGPASGRYAEDVRRLVSRLGLTDDVLLFGKVSYADLPAYYQHAKVNLFASSCENCPNILLEALAAGRPVLCSNYQPMPEFGADAVQYFDPYEPAELARLLGATLDCPSTQVEWGHRASVRARAFSWHRTAARTWEALRVLASTTH